MNDELNVLERAKPDAMIGVRMYSSEHEQVKAFAARKGVTVSDVILSALIECKVISADRMSETR